MYDTQNKTPKRAYKGLFRTAVKLAKLAKKTVKKVKEVWNELYRMADFEILLHKFGLCSAA